MWKRLKNNFDTGIEKIKWFSSLFSDRLKIEVSVMKLLYQSDEMAKKRDELMRTIGQRTYELKGYPDRYILKDRVIMEALSEIEKINNEIDATKKKASDISRIEA
jgi:tRNA/tmRNA/rRNA uracil-C5-methylase (TrmA/RlmC/RlmD family)